MKRILFGLILIASCTNIGNEPGEKDKKIIKMWLIGDSTMADYSQHPKYNESGRLAAGWGQVFQQFVSNAYLDSIKHFIKADSIIVDDRAVGGRTTRSFFEEGKWRAVYDSIQPGDFVIIQFGHNDMGIKIPEKYAKRGYPEFVDLGYKEYLRFYVRETREKGGIPILLTPVARNYPWEEGKLKNVHGNFPKSVKEIVDELDVLSIDLNQLSIDFFSSKGEEFVTEQYFMNLPAGKYERYPDGLKDNTHFKTKGAVEVARLVFKGLKEIANNL